MYFSSLKPSLFRLATYSKARGQERALTSFSRPKMRSNLVLSAPGISPLRHCTCAPNIVFFRPPPPLSLEWVVLVCCNFREFQRWDKRMRMDRNNSTGPVVDMSAIAATFPGKNFFTNISPYFFLKFSPRFCPLKCPTHCSLTLTLAWTQTWHLRSVNRFLISTLSLSCINAFFLRRFDTIFYIFLTLLPQIWLLRSVNCFLISGGGRQSCFRSLSPKSFWFHGISIKLCAGKLVHLFDVMEF